jgi:hypothetical protein
MREANNGMVEALPGKIRSGIEDGIREERGEPKWRCKVVLRDRLNPRRVRVLCRDEKELQTVKSVAERMKPSGARVLSDQLYPVKVDNVAARAILKPDGTVREEAVPSLEEENDVKIAKIVGLNKKESRKAYGSMAVYFVRGEQTAEALQSDFFSVQGESAYTAVFLPRVGPIRCYQCQELGHNAYECKGSLRCIRCGQQGPSHRDCPMKIPKCAICGGRPEASSKTYSANRGPSSPSL